MAARRESSRSFLGFLVVLLTFGGVAVVGNAIAPHDKHGAVIFGAVLLGLAAGLAVVGVILALRRATVREPPPRPRPARWTSDGDDRVPRAPAAA